MSIISGNAKRVSYEGNNDVLVGFDNSFLDYFGISRTSSGDGLGDQVDETHEFDELIDGVDIIGINDDTVYGLPAVKKQKGFDYEFD